MFVHGSLSESTLRGYSSNFKVSELEREKAGQEPLVTRKRQGSKVRLQLTVFMTSRCLVHANQSGTIRAYLAAIEYFHQMYAGWALSTKHLPNCGSKYYCNRPSTRQSKVEAQSEALTFQMLTKGRHMLDRSDEGGNRSCNRMGLALSYFLLCRASELWAYNHGLVHADDFCLTIGNLQFVEVGATGMEG